MSVILNPDWTFEELVNSAWRAYSSRIQFAGYRINTIKTWGNVVSKTVALAKFNEFIDKHGTKKNAAKYVGMSYSTLRGIEKFYESLPNDFMILRVPVNQRYTLNENIGLEEDLHNEFKSINSNNPVRSICDSFSKYAIGFLNSEGGRIFWGVRDVDAIVEGVELSVRDRDRVRTGIQNRINNIQPKVDPSSFKIKFIAVDGTRPDIFVVIAEIPKANTKKVYFTESGDCWVRVNGVTQIVKGPAIQELFLTKQRYYG